MTKNGHRMNKAEVIKTISGVRCNVKDWSLTEPHMQRISDDTYVLSYKAALEGTCPNPLNAGSPVLR